MSLTTQEIQTLLMGDKNKISIAKIIQAAKACLQLGMPNLKGESFYTVKGTPLEQTALVLILELCAHNKPPEEQYNLLLETAVALLQAGADITTLSNFGGSSCYKEWESLTLTSFSVILQSLPQLLKSIPIQTIEKSLNIVLTDIAVRPFFIKKNPQEFLDLIHSLPKIPDTLETHTFLFTLLLCQNKLIVLDAGNEKIFANIIKSVIEKLPAQSPIKSIFNFCITNNSLAKWLRSYPKSINWRLFTNVFNGNKLSSDEYNDCYSALMQHHLIHKLYELSTFDVSGHMTSENWQETVLGMIESKDARNFITKPLLENPIAPIAFNIQELIQQGSLRFKKFLGRTILFERVENKNIIALKVQKKGENPSELIKEAETLVALKKKQLASKLPEPMGVQQHDLKDILALIPERVTPQDLEQFKKMTESDTPVSVYCYEVTSENTGYFTYLHDPSLSEREFNQACRNAIYDLCVLLKENGLVFHQLADIFHNTTSHKARTDNGRYLVLTPLIRRFYEVSHSGRVDKWKESVEFVNLRATGLADVGDSSLFTEYKQFEIFQEITGAFAQGRGLERLPPSKHADERIHANLIGEYLFIFTLVCGRRAVELLKINPKLGKDQVFQDAAQQIFNISAQFLAQLTGISEKKATHYIAQCAQVSVLAKQMAFWMSSDYSLKALDLEELSTLYPGTELASLNFGPIQFVDKGKMLGKPGVGFANDNIHQDLGDYNCQNPMKEDNKIYYFVASMVRLYKDMGAHYRNASFEFETALAKNDFATANLALKKLTQNQYPEVKWQRKNNMLKKLSLFVAMKKNDSSVLDDLSKQRHSQIGATASASNLECKEVESNQPNHLTSSIFQSPKEMQPVSENAKCETNDGAAVDIAGNLGHLPADMLTPILEASNSNALSNALFAFAGLMLISCIALAAIHIVGFDVIVGLGLAVISTICVAFLVREDNQLTAAV